MASQIITRKPWWQVGLTILPGLLFLVASIFNGAGVGRFAFIVSIVLLLSAFWIVTRQRSLSEFPVWGIIPLGILAFWVSGFIVSFIFSWPDTFAYILGVIFSLGIVGLSVLIMIKYQRISHVPAITWGLIGLGGGVILFQWFVANGLSRFNSLPDWMMMAVLFSAGLLLAKEHGLYAVMLILPGGVFWMNFEVEPEIYFWDTHRFWNTIFDLAMPLLFYVITPYGVLRARTVFGQALGLLTPIAIYYVALVSAFSLVSVVAVSSGYNVMNAVSIAEPVTLLFLVFAFAGSLYSLISQQNLLGNNLKESSSQ